MKRLVVLVSVLAVCVAGIAALPGPATARGDKDCSDFKDNPAPATTRSTCRTTADRPGR